MQRLLCSVLAARALSWDVPSYRLGLDEAALKALLGLEDVAPAPTSPAAPVIATLHRLGLANRLRAAASARVFADDLGAELVVRWTAGGGLEAEPEDLFEAVANALAKPCANCGDRSGYESSRPSTHVHGVDVVRAPPRARRGSRLAPLRPRPRQHPPRPKTPG